MRQQDPLKSLKMKIDDRSHISQVDAKVCVKCAGRPCLLFCPSQVFSWDETKLVIEYERCVECGACLRGCPHANIAWDYPRAGYGIMYEV